MNDMQTTGPDLQLRRVAMGITQVRLAEAMGVTTNWITRRESKARVKAEDAEKYLAGLATFGTVPTVKVEVAA